MTVLWTAKSAAAGTGGSLAGNWRASGVSIDSRAIEAGDLFVAIRGPNTDGHLFVADALARGAAAAMVARDWAHSPAASANMKLIVVEDTLDGLNALAQAARHRGAARIAAITGSVGKTSAKETLAHVLSAQGPTTATQGNLNNQWGLPLSLARMPEESRFGIFELGMNHAGEIEPLSRLLQPDIALITTVEAVHMEFFASEEAIADAKAEIFAGMDGAGAAVLNSDNRHFERLRRQALAAGVGRVHSFGEDDEADFRLAGWRHADGGSAVEAEIDGRKFSFRIGAPGRHWAQIGVAVLGMAHLMGADIETAAGALADIRPPKGRGEQHRVNLPGGAFTVIDESYNASPASMRAAISVLGGTPCGTGGRRIAVLGDMLELGPQSAAMHAGLAPDLEADGIDLVFAAGPDMAGLFAALPAHMHGLHAAASDGLTDAVAKTVRAGDVVSVKGSLGSRMAPVVEALLALDTANDNDNGGAVRRVAGGQG
jgi:UDP-N-acetylmuramoyl-tripeptide--D-alanyl-D-alanine ligase